MRVGVDCDPDTRFAGHARVRVAQVEPVRLRVDLEERAGLDRSLDGSLSLPDEILAERDWVIASLHAAFDRNPTERVLTAMDNPHVDMIGHLTARKINIRNPADVSIERVVERAVETGTFLEINGQPDRLDLRDVHARAAKEAGLKLVVNSDGHQILAQNYVEFGIGQARRGWLTKDDVLNTRTWKQLDKLRRKRP